MIRLCICGHDYQRHPMKYIKSKTTSEIFKSHPCLSKVEKYNRWSGKCSCRNYKFSK